MRALPGTRVVQIFPEWPARLGTVREVNSEASAIAMLVGWDDGREDWIEEQDLGALGIWFIADEERRREPKPGPLATQLAKFMAEEAIKG